MHDSEHCRDTLKRKILGFRQKIPHVFCHVTIVSWLFEQWFFGSLSYYPDTSIILYFV